MKQVGLTLVALLAVGSMIGCGASKGYVKEQIDASEGRTNSRVDAVSSQTQMNADEIARLNTLTLELDKQVNIAVNKVKGFESYVVLWSGEINFDFDSFELTPTAQQILDEAGAQMKVHSGSLLEISGHTDAHGAKTYNMLLGERRASSAKTYIAEHAGVHLYRLHLVSFGEDKPATMSDSPNSDSRNRRVTLQLWGDPAIAQVTDTPMVQ